MLGLVKSDGCVTVSNSPVLGVSSVMLPACDASNRTSYKGVTAQPLAEGATERTAFVPCSTAFD